MSYKYLIKKKKLIKFWIYLGKNINTIFSSNYQFLNILYNKNCFLNFSLLLLQIKNIVPLFFNITQLNSNLLFLGSKFFYMQTIYNEFCFSIIKNVISTKPGVFTNFSITNSNNFFFLDFYFNPCIIIMCQTISSLTILIESKKKQIPIIGIVNLNSNTNLIDYPLITNTIYFYTIFFFSKFFFKLILLIK